MRHLSGKGKEPGWTSAADSILSPGASAAIALVDGQLDALGGDSRCPFPTLKDRTALFAEEASGATFHLTSDAPIFATYYFGYGVRGGADATTALRSVGSWYSEYIDVGVYRPGRTPQQSDRTGQYATNWEAAAIVTALEPVQVTFEKDHPGHGGQRVMSLLGEQAHHFLRDDLYIGTPIRSTRPFGLFVGSAVTFMPFNTGMSDAILTQVPAPRDWASEYAAVGHPPRRLNIDDAPLYRLIAAKDGTKLTYDPAPPPDAPLALAAGELAVFRTSTPFVVRSQDQEHRFYASVAMTGSNPLCDAEPNPAGEPGDVRYVRCPGDPELLNVTPSAEYARQFAFTTVHNFADVYLVLVRKKRDDRFADVTLDCAGTITGWKPIGSGSTFETATVALSQGNYAPQIYPSGTCELGAHTMFSDAPFTGYIWAWTHAGVDGLDPDDDGSHRSYGFALYGTEPDRGTH